MSKSKSTKVAEAMAEECSEPSRALRNSLNRIKEKIGKAERYIDSKDKYADKRDAIKHKQGLEEAKHIIEDEIE